MARLERHRADVAKRRMEPPVIVKPQPVDRFVFCSSARGKTHAMQALDLQPFKQRFGDGLALAIAPAAH